MGYCLAWPGFRGLPAVVWRGIRDGCRAPAAKIDRAGGSSWGDRAGGSIEQGDRAGGAARAFSLVNRALSSSWLSDLGYLGTRSTRESQLITARGSRAGRFNQRPAGRGRHVSLKEKARSKAGHVVGVVVLVVTCRGPCVRNIRCGFPSVVVSTARITSPHATLAMWN